MIGTSNEGKMRLERKMSNAVEKKSYQVMNLALIMWRFYIIFFFISWIKQCFEKWSSLILGKGKEYCREGRHVMNGDYQYHEENFLLLHSFARKKIKNR